MKRLFICSICLFSALALLALNGCKSGHASGGKPAVLHYAFSAQAEQMEGGGLRTELMRKYLSEQLHMPVDVVRVEGYAPAIEAMRTEKIDVANFGSLSYIIAAQKAGAQAIVARGTPDGKIGGYHSVIAVPKNSPYHSLADLKAHAKDIVFAFADPASTSGNLYPRVGLLNAGIDPEKDFKKVVFAGGHPASVMTVKMGKVDASAFMESAPRRLIKANKMAADDIRVIWSSDLIPNSCYAVRGSLPDQLKKDIQTAIVSIPTKDPALWAHMTSLYNNVLTSNSGTVNVPVSDATYDVLRKYASQVKDFNFVEK
jgi:phosphonate transport system substrate-binding protein